MVFTEIKQRNGKKYFYRVRSVRKGGKVSKDRLYMGVNLDKEILQKKEDEADEQLYLKKRNEAVKNMQKVIFTMEQSSIG